MAHGATAGFKFDFNIGRIIAAKNRKVRKGIFGAGSYTKNAMQRGMGRKRKAVSSPGQYPSVHAGALKNAIKFAVSSDLNSVVIGPEFRKRSDGIPVPKLVNAGGTINFRRITKRTGRHIQARYRYRPRPFVDLTRPAGIAVLRKNMAAIPFI